MYKNNEGYADPTAGKAIENINNEEKEKRGIVKAVTNIIHITGYELVTPINIKKLRK